MPENWSERIQEAVRLERAGMPDRALEWLEGGAPAESPDLEAERLRHRADIHRTRCEWDAALADARRSREVAERAGLSALAAEALNAEAAVYMSRREYPKATELLVRILAITEDARVRGIALQNLGVIAAEEGRLGAARRHFDASQVAFRSAGYERGVALALVNSGRVALLEGDDRAAERLCAEGERSAEGVGDLEIAAMAAFNRAEALVRSGRHREAEEPASIALGYFTGAGNHWRRMECLRLFGDLNRATGDVETARQCYVQAMRVAREAETPLDVSRIEKLMGQLA